MFSDQPFQSFEDWLMESCTAPVAPVKTWTNYKSEWADYKWNGLRHKTVAIAGLHWSQKKKLTIQEIRSRIWDMIDDW